MSELKLSSPQAKPSMRMVLWMIVAGFIPANPVHANGATVVDIKSVAISASETDGDQACPASLVLGSDRESLETLRRFRDEYLMKTEGGRVLAGMYYEYGPYACRLIERSPQLKEKSALILKEVVPLLTDQQGNISPQGFSDYIDCILEVLGEIDECSGFDFDCILSVLSQVFDCF